MLTTNKQERAPQRNSIFTIYFVCRSFHGVGCLVIDSVRLVKLKTCPAELAATGPASSYLSKKTYTDDNVETILKQWENVKCKGLSLWEPSPEELAATENSDILVEEGFLTQSKDACLALEATFDSSWAMQKQPDPAVPPRTHMVRARIEEAYRVKVKNSLIDTTKTKVFGFGEKALGSGGVAAAGGGGGGGAAATVAPTAAPTVAPTSDVRTVAPTAAPTVAPTPVNGGASPSPSISGAHAATTNLRATQQAVFSLAIVVAVLLVW